MKHIKSILCMAALLTTLAACSDDDNDFKAFDSVVNADFTFDQAAEIVAGESSVQFVNTSTASGTDITEYFWHFGFAGIGNWSEDANPAPVCYKEAGEYTVTLTAYGADGNKCSMKRTITIVPPNLAPKAAFSYTPEVVEVNVPVTFTDTSTDSDGEIASRQWQMPDGTTSAEPSLTYTFAEGGTFSVTLTVTDNRGASNSLTKTVFVLGGESTGSGTADDPWLITNADRWNEMAASINGGGGDYAANAHYMLAGDVDFSGKSFAAWRSFSGVLNGNNCKLMGITVSNTVDAADVDNKTVAPYGIVCVNSGTIKDLTVEANFTSNGHRLGGVVGKNDGTIDGVRFRGTLSGDKRTGGIAGENNSLVINCATLAGSVIKASDVNGDGAVENCGGVVGGNTNKNAFVINCYSHAESVSVTGGNNAGGVVGYGGSDSFEINCYSAVGTVTAAGTIGSAIGYIKKSNVQNVYGNSAISAVIGNAKNSGDNAPSVWTTPATQSLSLDNMLSGAVTIPSSKVEKSSFVEALNAGVDIFDAATFDRKPSGINLRRWTANGSYPVLE